MYKGGLIAPQFLNMGGKAMTIIEAINKLDNLKPNGYTQSDKIGWLSILDGSIKRSVIDTHEGGESVSFNGYTEETPLDTELIAYAPYDEMYVSWLQSKVDYYNGEYAKYNNSITRYNDAFSAYVNDYNRTHMPKGESIRYY